MGADAQTLEQSVATPIEQQINGVDNMNYMYSLNATGNSSTTLIADFDVKTDPNTDLILTQSRENLAAAQLPARREQLWRHASKSRPPRRSCWSPCTRHTALTMRSSWPTTPISTSTIPIARLYGVGQTQVFGAGQYAMRLWVKPDQLAKLGITVTDISNAIQAQNTVNPAGQVGGEPAPDRPAIYLFGARSGPSDFAGAIRKRHRA